MKTIIKSLKKEITIGKDYPFVVIGERINPTGRKKLASALMDGDREYVQKLALEQVSWGADVLDINVGVPGIDEVSTIKWVVESICSVTDVPLCLDSANIDVLTAGLAISQGKVLVNSVSGERDKLRNVIPLVKEHGAAVIALTMDDDGIPSTSEHRLVIAKKIIEVAINNDISIENIIIDPLVLSVGADHNAANITLKTIELIREHIDININVGASNVSFGLPNRPLINQTFLAMCIQAGATCAITDPSKYGPAVKASELLLGSDENSMRYLKYYRIIEKLKEEM